MDEFVHLHVHSEYSLLDGANRISDLVAQLESCRRDIDILAKHKASRIELDLITTALRTATEATNAVRLTHLEVIDIVHGVLAILTAPQDEDVRPKMEQLIVTLDKLQAFHNAAEAARRLLA